MDKKGGYTVNIRWKPNEHYTTWLPYLPRKGDVLNIYNDNYDDGQKILEGEVVKVIYWENTDTKHAGDPNFDIFIE